MAPTDITIEILENIRDEVPGVRSEARDGLASVRTEPREGLAGVHECMDRMERRQTEAEPQIATERVGE